jgi:hypothetical protein
MAGTLIAGLDSLGVPDPIRTDGQGGLTVAELAGDDLLREILLEVRAMRIGMELSLGEDLMALVD